MKFVDIHCHCLPNLDDGPESAEGALALCRLLVADNVGVAVATPHQLGQFENRTDVDDVLETVEWLNQRLATESLDLTVLPGAEVRLDERIGALLAEGKILTLADRNQHVLLELPDDVFIDIETLIFQLEDQGVHIIVAHPERNARLTEQPRVLERWLGHGVSLQITAASLLGGFGPRAEETAWRLIREGRAVAVATDAHDVRGCRPCMTAAFKRVAEVLGLDLACLLCIHNPSRLTGGEGPVPVRTWDWEVQEPW
jgi:protein-tyrosine phosphatase